MSRFKVAPQFYVYAGFINGIETFYREDGTTTDIRFAPLLRKADAEKLALSVGGKVVPEENFPS